MISRKKISLGLFFLGPLLLPSLSLAQAKVSLVIYVDLSKSMDHKRAQVAAMAGYIADNLKSKCGEYEIAVSNINYKDARSGGGGELIAGSGEPLFITEQTPNSKQMLKNRIATHNIASSGGVEYLYQTGIQELTYSSVALTLADHLNRAPGGLNATSAVGVLIITDAAPFFEPVSPADALALIKSNIGGRPFIAGALGSTTPGQCMDTTPSAFRGTVREEQMKQIELLKIFTHMADGYHWNMCESIDIEQSVKDFLIMLMDKAQCQLIAKRKSPSPSPV